MSEPVVLVTGASRRIGAAITRRFHREGYRVIIHCHQSIDDANTLCEALTGQRTGSATVLQQDLGQLEALPAFMQRCHDAFGRLDVIVNNASVFYPTPFRHLEPAQLDDMLTTNLKAPVLIAKSAVTLLTPGSSIINILDIHSEIPLPGYMAYSMSKAGLAMMVRSLAVELAPDIRVNGVSPGAILWPEDQAEMIDAEKEDLIAGIPMGELGSTEDIAAAVFYLAAEAGYVTGQIINVDGGRSVS